MVILTTMHNTVRVTKDAITKPDVYKMYDHTKGGVDIVDLISSHSSIRMKSRRWTLNALAFILDTERTNAMTILKDARDSQLTSFEFTWQLGKNLVVPPNNGLQSVLLTKMRKILGVIERPHNLAGSSQSVGRCHVCVSKIVYKPNYKKEREALNHRVKTHCMKCDIIICKDHQKYICQSCLDR